MSAPAEAATVQAQDYLASVERELGDLPSEERSALLEDLAAHLGALADEDDDRPLTVRLGSPEAYAAELRAAAGLPPRSGSADGPRPAAAWQRSREVWTTVRRRAVPEVRRLLAELRPAWWVLRGYLLVLVPCLLEVDGGRDFPVPAPLGSDELGVVLVLAAVAGSVALGRRALPRAAGVLVGVLGLVLVAGAAVVWNSAAVARGPSGGGSVAAAPDQALGEHPLLSRYGPVTDVLPYAADGTPLEGVLLYDQDGRPLQVGFQEWWADACVRGLDQPVAADGVPVPHSFPQRYELLELDVDLYSMPVAAGQCLEEIPRPDVPLPVFATGRAAG